MAAKTTEAKGNTKCVSISFNLNTVIDRAAYNALVEYRDKHEFTNMRAALKDLVYTEALGGSGVPAAKPVAATNNQPTENKGPGSFTVSDSKSGSADNGDLKVGSKNPGDLKDEDVDNALRFINNK